MEVLPAAEATLVEGISLQKYLCVFVFYFYVTLVYGKSDHFEDMELELECRIFQPSCLQDISLQVCKVTIGYHM